MQFSESNDNRMEIASQPHFNSVASWLDTQLARGFDSSSFPYPTSILLLLLIYLFYYFPRYGHRNVAINCILVETRLRTYMHA